MVFCQECGSKLVTRMSASGETKTSICKSSRCRMEYVIPFECAGAAWAFQEGQLTPEEHKARLELFKIIGISGRIR